MSCTYQKKIVIYNFFFLSLLRLRDFFLLEENKVGRGFPFPFPLQAAIIIIFFDAVEQNLPQSKVNRIRLGTTKK